MYQASNFQSKKDLMRLLTLLFLLTPMILVFLGCQLSPKLSQTTDFNEEAGRIFIHELHKTQDHKTKVLIDGEEVSDLALLDQFGIPMDPGEHEVEFQDLPVDSGISEIDYKIVKNKDLHLYYCEKNGSFHWFMKPAGEKFEKNGAVCEKISTMANHP